MSVQQACRVVRLSRTAYYQPPVPASRRDAAVIAALTDAVTRYPRWGFWKLFDRLRVEGRSWNYKHVHRVYCALRLNLPRRTTRRVPKRIRQPLVAPPVLNQTWALDFMTETLYDGRRVRLLTMIDEGNREGLEIAMGVSLPSHRVVRVLNELVALHGCPHFPMLRERNTRRGFLDRDQIDRICAALEATETAANAKQRASELANVVRLHSPRAGGPPRRCCRSNGGTSIGTGAASAWTRTRRRMTKAGCSRSQSASR
jgi:hypothetical protein